MTNLKLFLRDGKWYGNEFPEPPETLLHDTHQKYQHACTKWEAALDKLKAEAPEVVNPEILSPKIFKFSGGYAIQNGILESAKVVDGVLYPWDGGAEIEHYVSDVNDTSEWQIVSKELYEAAKTHPESGRSVKQVLRLLPKSPVVEKCIHRFDGPSIDGIVRCHWCGIDRDEKIQSDIAAIGVPESRESE